MGKKLGESWLGPLATFYLEALNCPYNLSDYLRLGVDASVSIPRWAQPYTHLWQGASDENEAVLDSVDQSSHLTNATEWPLPIPYATEELAIQTVIKFLTHKIMI